MLELSNTLIAKLSFEIGWLKRYSLSTGNPGIFAHAKNMEEALNNEIERQTEARDRQSDLDEAAERERIHKDTLNALKLK